MSLMPCARSTAMISRPTGPAPVTRTRSSGRTSASRSACRVIAVGSASAAGRVGKRIGDPDQPVGRHCLVLAERPAVAGEVRRGALQAHRRAAPAARPAGATPRGGVAHHPVAGRPARVIRRGSHNARPLVAENGTRPGVALQHHVQIGAADAAGGDLHQHLVGAGLRTWDLVELDPALAHIDGRRHQFRGHGATLRRFSRRCREWHCRAGLVGAPPSGSTCRRWRRAVPSAAAGSG